MSDSKIINFEDMRRDQSLISYDLVLESDDYLKITVINALDKAGYEISTQGVTNFQNDNKREPTGVMSIKDLAIAIQVFDNDQIQTIYDHIDRMRVAKLEEEKLAREERKKKEIKDNITAFIATMIIMLCVGLFIYGCYCAGSKAFNFIFG